MREHPTELELARWAEDGRPEELMEHLRWCRRCRNDVSEYRWLQEEIDRALKAEAGGAPVPEPDWRCVWKQIDEGPGAVSPAGRRAAAVSLAAMVCLMLAVPLVVVGGNRAWAMAPRLEDVSTAPTPVPAGADGRAGTPTSRADGGERQVRRESLPFVPPPTPPEQQD